MHADSRARWRLPLSAAVVLVVAALAVAIVLGMLRTSSPEAVEELPAAERIDASIEVYVHVSGAVRQPGLYRLTSGSRVVDAVSAAGGFTRRADHAAVNLARPVADGEQLHIPRRGEKQDEGASAPQAGGSGVGGSGGQAGKVNLNTADTAALETLPRIGPALAARIIEWREQHGPFATVDDLIAVPGIGDKLLAGLRESATV